MADLVVTVPKGLWADWIEEGDAVGEPSTGIEWGFFVGFRKPRIRPGERLYIVAHGQLRGYAPVTRIAFDHHSGWAIGRHGGAVACTIEKPIAGFRGWRYRSWEREDELPFPGWMIDGVPPRQLEDILPQIRWPDWDTVEAQASLGHPFAVAMLEIFEQIDRAVPRVLKVRDLIDGLVERLAVDSKTATVIACRAVDRMREWDIIGRDPEDAPAQTGEQHG